SPVTTAICLSLTVETLQIAKVAMPRGSRPGERRGGRQKGTPNRKTALRNAALSAAAADPNLSPLDYLLNVMRQQTLPLETRVAAAREALPYFHSKPQESVARQATPGKRATNDAIRSRKLAGVSRSRITASRRPLGSNTS